MLPTQTNHGAFDAVNRVGVSLFVVFICSLVFSADSASAASILSDYSLSSAELRNSLEPVSNELDLLGISGSKIDECGCGCVPTNERIASDQPSNPELQNQVGLAPSSNCSGTNSTGSSISDGVRLSAAILGPTRAHDANSLIDWLRIEQSLDVPPAPPFQLLRPPICFF